MNPSYPYRLRLVHQGLGDLRVERPGRFLRFDPRGEVGDGELVVLSGAVAPPRRPALRRGATAPGPREGALALGEDATLAAWRAGGVGLRVAPAPYQDPDGLRVELEPYVPLEPRRPGLRGALGRLRGPRRGAPQLCEVRLADGGRLLHLGLALHEQTDDAWLRDLAARRGGPDWLLLGCPRGQQDALARRVELLRPRRILLLDLLGDARQGPGGPPELLTPLCDRLQARGAEAGVLASGVSYRYEHMHEASRASA